MERGERKRKKEREIRKGTLLRENHNLPSLMSVMNTILKKFPVRVMQTFRSH